ncbi:MAG: MBL fold metallo-hydrolase, partial [Nitrospinota bacterium]
MRVIVLGCGTSTGVPTIGCECPTCVSTHPRNKRTRASIYIEEGQAGVLVDASTDLRAQALAQGIRRVDAVLFTHCHADHVFG